VLYLEVNVPSVAEGVGRHNNHQDDITALVADEEVGRIKVPGMQCLCRKCTVKSDIKKLPILTPIMSQTFVLGKKKNRQHVD
jgi:hypothetical protein